MSQKHAALLVLTRYKAHFVTLLQESPIHFCPACGKTTKDYGGKKHIYNPFGTLLSMFGETSNAIQPPIQVLLKKDSKTCLAFRL